MYKNMVRQHLDLETIQAKLDGELASYSSSLSFYRDLLLLFTNAIVFFPTSSTPSLAAHQLRSLVLTEMKRETQKSDSTQLPDTTPPQPKVEPEKSAPLLDKQKPAVAIVVCRRRSSMSAKPSSSSSGQKIEQQQQQPKDSNDNKPASDLKPAMAEQSLLKMKPEPKPVTGARSSRRSNKNLTKTAASTSKKQNAIPATKATAADKPETARLDKKKTEALALEKKKSAADFLKRIKKNAPAEALKKNSRGGGNNSTERKRDNNSGKEEKGKERGKERVLRSNGDRKQAEENNSPSKRSGGGRGKNAASEGRGISGKRGRDGGGKEPAKKPKKRSRR